MKYKLIYILIFLFLPWAALAAESVRSVNIDMSMDADSTFEVDESISYAGGVGQDGFYERFIPLEFDAGGERYRLKVDGLSVTDSNGTPYYFELGVSDGVLNLKIALPGGAAANQSRSINIKYGLSGAVREFDGRDHFVFTPISPSHDVEIDSVKASVILPENIGEAELSRGCRVFWGDKGKKCVSGRYEYAGRGVVEGVVFISDRLRPGRGMEISLSFPKDYTRPGVVQRLWRGALFFNSALLAALCVFMVVWLLRSKRERKKWHRRFMGWIADKTSKYRDN